MNRSIKRFVFLRIIPLKKYKSLSGPIHSERFTFYSLWTNNSQKKLNTRTHTYLYIRGATEPIRRVLASSDGISCWTPLKPQHSNSNLNPNPLANQLWGIYFLTPPTPLIIPHRLPAFLESLMPLKNSCSIHARSSKSSLKHSIRFCGLFSKFKTEFYCISFFLTSRLHFWNSPAVTIKL